MQREINLPAVRLLPCAASLPPPPPPPHLQPRRHLVWLWRTLEQTIHTTVCSSSQQDGPGIFLGPACFLAFSSLWPASLWLVSCVRFFNLHECLPQRRLSAPASTVDLWPPPRLDTLLPSASRPPRSPPSTSDQSPVRPQHPSRRAATCSFVAIVFICLPSLFGPRVPREIPPQQSYKARARPWPHD